MSKSWGFYKPELPDYLKKKLEDLESGKGLDDILSRLKLPTPLLRTSSRVLVEPSQFLGPVESPRPPARKGSKALTIAPSGALTIGPGAQVVGQTRSEALWIRRDWTCSREGKTETYRGNYVVRTRWRRRRYRGVIEVVKGRLRGTYVQAPDGELERHRKHICFHKCRASLFGEGFYEVHWNHRPESVDEAILYVEKILMEAVNGSDHGI